MRVGDLSAAARDGVIDETDRSTGPARGRAAGAVPEPDTIEVPTGRPDDVGIGDLDVVERADGGDGLGERRGAPTAMRRT